MPALRYASDDRPGISRVRRGRGLSYGWPDGRRLADPRALARIRSLAIPPAWTQVWISPHPNGHLPDKGIAMQHITTRDGTLLYGKDWGQGRPVVTDVGPDLSAFTMPTLVLHGTSDQAVPIETSARRAVPAIPGCPVREYVDGPHGLLASHEDEVCADVMGVMGVVRTGALPEPAPALAALLLPHILKVFLVVAPCQPGASRPSAPDKASKTKH